MVSSSIGEDFPRQHVTEAAAQRHFTLEGAAAENQRFRSGGILEPPGNAADIDGQVLAISIRRHHADGVRAGRQQHVIEGGLERLALAEVDGVREQRHVR